MALLPKLIATSIMEGISEPEYPYATGSGLHGLTRPLLQAAVDSGYMDYAEETVQALKTFSAVLEEALAALQANDTAVLTALLQEGHAIYNAVYPQGIRPAA